MLNFYKVFYKILLFFFLVWGLNSTVFGQAGPGSNWYFGEHAGLSFNSGTPVALSGGQLVTQEGCASISDANGNLLFYTNGVSVWNKNHQQTPNGFGLLGDDSSTQSAVIVSKPGSSGHYYIFTVDLGWTGLAYSEFDMALAGGLGDVVAGQKNIILIGNTTEKLTAVGNAAGNGYWIMVHQGNSNRFMAFSVTAGGVNSTPVDSYIGTNCGGALIGYMKIASTGKKLALAVMDMSIGEVFDFDPATGKVTNPLTLPDISTSYGVEFSPDAKKLYIASLCPGVIYQYDLSAGSSTAILNSKKAVGTQNVSCGGALQLAPDGKIYACRYQENNLSVIHKPNEAGMACNFQDIAVTLKAGTFSRIGLPTFNQSFFDNNVCTNSTLRFLSLFNKIASCLTCLDGKIVASATGGVAPYTYSLNGGPFQNTGIFNNLPRGVFTITIKDSQGCEVKRVLKI